MGNRYVKLHADKKSRKYEKKHTAKGYPKRYRLACRKAHEHLLQTGGGTGQQQTKNGFARASMQKSFS